MQKLKPDLNSSDLSSNSLNFPLLMKLTKLHPHKIPLSYESLDCDFFLIESPHLSTLIALLILLTNSLLVILSPSHSDL